jgi:hypothetical protein
MIVSRCSIGRSKAGPFGRTVLPLDQALKFIASEDIFWAIQ